MSRLRRLVGRLAPPVLLEALHDVRERLDRPDPGLAALAGRHQGRCFLVGNGPSLKQTDLAPLEGRVVISANSFYKHPLAHRLAPRYHCVGDPHFMKDEPRAIDWHRTLAGRFPAATFVLHEAARPLVAHHGLYTGSEVHYVRPGRGVHDERQVNTDLSRRLNVGATTGSTIMVPLAIHLGFTSIVLVGFDCNWLDDPDASYHFYDTHELYPEFDSTKTDGRGYGYEGELRMISREFESHRLLAARARSLGVEVINATKGGRLDVYPRGALEELARSQ